MSDSGAVFIVPVFAFASWLALVTLLVVSVILWFREGRPLLMPPRAEKLMRVGLWLVWVTFGLMALMVLMALMARWLGAPLAF